MRPMVCVATITAALVLWSLLQPAKADFKICNKTAEKITVAAAYVNPNGGGFISEGWWTVNPCGGCKTIVLSRETSDPHNYWYYADGGGLVWQGSEDHFCTTEEAFKILGAERNCAGRGFDERKFVNVTSASGNTTTNLTGHTLSGKVCF